MSRGECTLLTAGRRLVTGLRKLQSAVSGVALMMALGTGVSVQASETRRFGLFIGQNEGGRNTQRLLYADSDAQKMQEVLERLGSLEPRESQLVLAASRAQVLDGITSLARKIQQARKEGARTVLYFYYSGHADAQGLRLGSGRLSMLELKEALKQTGADLRIVLLDACQSGGITGTAVSRLKGGTRAPSFLVQVDEGDQLTGEAIITSSSADEASQESDQVGGGYFTHHLVAGLLGAADSSRDGQVSLDEVYHYAYHRTLFETADSAGGLQHAGIQTELRGHGQLILTRPNQGQTILVLPQGLSGHYLVFDRERRLLMAELRLSGEQEQRLALPSGKYLIQKRAADHLLSTEVVLTRGTLKQLEPTQLVRSGYEQDFSRGVMASNLLRAQGPRIRLSAFSSVQGFFFQPEGTLLYPSFPMVGMELEVRAPGFGNWSMTMDASAGGTNTTLDAVYSLPTRYVEMQAGVGLRFTLPFSARPLGPSAPPLKLGLGPHIEALYVSRSFPGTREPREVSLTTAPGVVLDLTLGLSSQFSLGLQGRGHFLLYLNEGENLSLGHAELLLKVGYGF